MAELSVPNGDGILAMHHQLAGYSRDLVCTIGVGIDEGEPFDQAAVNGLQNAWAQNMKATVTPNLTFLRSVFYWKQPLGYVPFVSNIAPVVGTSSGTSLPPNCAVMIEKTTSRPGRAGRGRMFFPGISEGAVDAAGVISSAFLTQFATSLNAFYAFATDEGGIFDDLLLYHSTEDIDPTPTVINSLVANARTSSIAKRFRRNRT